MYVKSAVKRCFCSMYFIHTLPVQFCTNWDAVIRITDLSSRQGLDLKPPKTERN